LKCSLKVTIINMLDQIVDLRRITFSVILFDMQTYKQKKGQIESIMIAALFNRN
jgi:hypothetical protein